MYNYWRSPSSFYQQDSRFIGFGLLPFVAGLGLGGLLLSPFAYGRPYPPPYPFYPPYPYPYPAPPPPVPYAPYPQTLPYRQL